MRKMYISAALFLVLGLFGLGAGNIFAEKIEQQNDAILQKIVPVDGKWANMGYSELMEKWTQWLLAQPVDSNPGLDSTGEYGSMGQSGAVWFLAGTFTGGVYTRDCTVPAGRAIFFPMYNIITNFPFPDEDIDDLWTQNAAAMSCLTFIECKIDGVSIMNPLSSSYRAKSAEAGFDFYIPEDNVYKFLFADLLPILEEFGIDFAEGWYEPAVVDGYWILLRPLPAGKHTIQFRAEASSPFYSFEITYNLTVTGS